MLVQQLKEKLHAIIENAEDKKLEAIYTLLQPDEISDHKYELSDLEIIYERRNNFLEGNLESITTEQFVNYVKQNSL